MKKTGKEKIIEKKSGKIKKSSLAKLEAVPESPSGIGINDKTEKKKKLRDIFYELTGTIGAPEARDPALAAASILRGLLLGVLAFLFGRTSVLLDTYPLAIALLASSEKKLIYIFIGAAASAFAVSASDGVLFSPYIYIAAYAMTALIRLAARIFIDPPTGFDAKLLLGRRSESGSRMKQLRLLFISRFEENIYLRMATACVAAFFVSLYAMRAGSYRFYDLFSAMFAMVCAPAVTFIFSNLWIEDRDRLGQALRAVAALSMLTAAVFALRDTYLLGVSASAFIAFGASVYLGMKKGILIGAFAGFAAGLAFSPIYSPAFVLAAIAAGVMSKSAPVAATVSTCVAMLWGAYIDGFGSFTALMPALLSASVLVCAADQLGALPFISGKKAAENVGIKAVNNEATESAEARIERLSVTFGELSKALYDISDRIRSPGSAEIGAICTRSFEMHCLSCPKNEECHIGQYGEFSEMVSKVGEILRRDGRVRSLRLPEHIPSKCIKLEDVLIEINTSFAELIRERVTGEKTELFALDYDGISHILADAVEDSKRENEIDEEMTEILRRAASRPEIGMKEISVRGLRKKRIYSGDIGKKAEKMGICEIREELEKAFGAPLCDPVFELKNGKVAMRTEAARRFEIESGKAAAPGKGESVCGDSAELFDNRNDNFYALISDGMGSGQSAAYTSEICSLFLSKMLRGGNKKETALKMLNTLLRSKGEECSATVDLMEIDLIEGKASFIKSGAAPSFVRRGDKLYKLRSNTAPIGIMRSIDAEQIHFEIEDGDIMIMLSDGISQSPEECFWLMEMLGGEWDINENLDSFAERIAKRAAEEGSTDDASVVLVRVNEIKRKAS